RHDHAGRAVAALQAVLFPETFLHRVQLAIGCQPFNRRDLAAISLDGQARTGFKRATVHMDGTRPTLAGIAADVGAGQAEFLTQKMDKEHSRLDIALVARAVYGNAYFHRVPPKESYYPIYLLSLWRTNRVKSS